MSRFLFGLVLAALLGIPAAAQAGQDPAPPPPATQDNAPPQQDPSTAQQPKKGKASRLKDKFSSGCVAGIGCWGDKQKPDSDPGPAPPQSAPAPAASQHPASESSSKDTQVDLGPPTGPAAKPAGSDTVQEMTPWDPHRAAKDIEVGNLYKKQGNYRAAISRFRDALDYKANDAEATFRMAESLEKLGEVEDSAAYYESYLKILPRGEYAAAARAALARLRPMLGDLVPEARSPKGEEDIQLGEFSYSLTNYPGAAEHFVHALQLDPRDSMAHLRLAQALEKMGRVAEAHEQYEAYLALLPKGPFAAEVRREMARMGPPPAPVVAPPKPDTTITVETAEKQLENGEYAAATERLRAVLAVEPENPRALFRLAQALEAQGQRDQAVAAYQHYLKVDANGPYSVPALLALDRLSRATASATSPPSQTPR